MTSLKRKLLAGLTVGLAIGTLMFTGSSPAISDGTVQFNGSTAEQVGLFGGGEGLVIVNAAPRLSGAAAPSVQTQITDSQANPTPFNGVIQMGEISKGDGTNDVYGMQLRVRGNTKCFVTSTVSALNVTSLRWQNAPATFRDLSAAANLAGFDMITLGNLAPVAGAHGNAGANVTMNDRWNTNALLSTLNAGAVGAITSTKDRVATFTDAPSQSGNWNTVDNYVQLEPRITVPTGFKWSPVPGVAGSNLQATFQFEAYLGA